MNKLFLSVLYLSLVNFVFASKKEQNKASPSYSEVIQELQNKYRNVDIKEDSDKNNQINSLILSDEEANTNTNSPKTNSPKKTKKSADELLKEKNFEKAYKKYKKLPKDRTVYLKLSFTADKITEEAKSLEYYREYKKSLITDFKTYNGDIKFDNKLKITCETLQTADDEFLELLGIERDLISLWRTKYEDKSNEPEQKLKRKKSSVQNFFSNLIKEKSLE